MSLARTLKRLILGETWILPLGIATVVLVSALIVRPLMSHDVWRYAGGFVLLTGIATVLALSIATSARR